MQEPEGVESIGALLAAWHSGPMGAEQAGDLLASSQARLRQSAEPDFGKFWLQVQVLVAHFWLERPCAVEYEYLRSRAEGDEQAALLELVYGQLLLSRKLVPALEHLHRGFWLAAGSLSARDYFRVLARHRDLEDLVLSASPSPPRTLDELLTEAAVIRELTGGLRPSVVKGHDDTLG